MGLDKLTAIWNRIRDSLWFIPALLSLAAVLLAVITIRIDMAGILPEAPGGLWLFGGTASGAQGVLTAIATSFITVTGVVFSITIVALQLASTQFTPRILRNFTADRANQVVLGAFIATFTYALMILRVVRGERGDPSAQELDSAARAAGSIEAFVPNFSVTVAVALAIVSIGLLIFFIDHAARSVQASVIIDRVTEDALQTLKRQLAGRVGEAGEATLEEVLPEGQGAIVTSGRSGYVQGVDEQALLDLLHADALTIRMEPEIGDYLLPGAALATIWPAGTATLQDVEETIRSAFVLGYERTPHLDLELPVIELTDMAVKALSPGVNDPTTAVLCVDRLAEILLAVARQPPPGRVRQAADHDGVLILPRTEFGDLVGTAFDEIRHYGVENPRFASTFLHRLTDLGALLPHEHRPPVARQVAALLRAAPDAIREPADLRSVQSAGERALAVLGVTAPPEA